MKKLSEDFTYLEELLRKVNSLISPITIDAELAWLMDRSKNRDFYDKYPKCWLPIKVGQEVPFFPVCNRMGMIEPEIISFSLRLADRATKYSQIDQDHLNGIIHKLKVMYARYGKDTPKPATMAAKKGMTTKMLNKVKKYLDDVR